MKKPIKPSLPIKPRIFDYDKKSSRKEIREFYSTPDLQSVIDCCPANIDYKDICIEAWNHEDSYCENIITVVYYEKLEARPNQYKEDLLKYKKDLKEYNSNLEKYEAEKALYDKEKIKEKIQKLQDKLKDE